MQYTTNQLGWAEDTIHIVCTDTAQTFSSAQLLNSNDSQPSACLITVEGENVRFAHESTPVSGADGAVGALGHVLYTQQSYLITNTKNIKNFTFVNAVAGTAGDIMVTMFYEIGK